jgi:hypothetical protein
MASFGRKNEPLTVIWLLGGPAVTSRERNALTGVGVGGGVGDGVGDGEGAGDGDGDGEAVCVGFGEGAVGDAATRMKHRGRVARTRMSLIRSSVG